MHVGVSDWQVPQLPGVVKVCANGRPGCETPATADGIQVLPLFCVELKGVTAMGQRGATGLLHMIPGSVPIIP